jgi:hypothetical protein
MPLQEISPLLSSAKLIHDQAISNPLENNLSRLQDDPILNPLMEFFGLTDPTESILLAWFLVKGWSSKEIKINDILEAFGNDLKNIQMYRSALQSLGKKGYLQSTIGTTTEGKDLGGSYGLPLFVLEAAIANDLSLLTPAKADNIRIFLSVIFRKIKRFKDKEIDLSALTIQITRLENEQMHLNVLQQLFEFGLPTDERLLLYFLLYSRMDDGYVFVDLVEMLKEIFTDPMEHFWLNTKFRNNQLVLQQSKLAATHTNEMLSEARIHLTNKTFELFFKGTVIANSVELNVFDVIKPSQTNPETLYFTGKEAAQIEIVHQAMQPAALDKLQQALRSANHSPAITVLLHGFPGTGKTASVMQWARASGRAVFRVQVAKIRSMWVGGSERNVQRIFDEYESASREYDLMPILLFNEADALLSKRITIERNVDQMHNTMQNILLQAMENFNGILVATTNLVQQLDAAFHRRFLYKIEFAKPDKQVRLKLLRDVFPMAEHGWLAELDDRFELTGAQIRNLGKRLLLQQLLQDGNIDRASLLQAAGDELTLPGTGRSQSIGFQVFKHCSSLGQPL